MDYVNRLKERRKELLAASSSIRKDIDELVDELSFVELSAYSYSENEFSTEAAHGEGVVTGFASIDGFPVYVVAENADVCAGGLGKANSEKIVKCLNAAERASAPVVYLLGSHGVRMGEGVDALEGIAELLAKAVSLKKEIAQFAIVKGDCFGASAVLAANADAAFFADGACVCSGSPFVAAARSGKTLDKALVGGYEVHTKSGAATFRVKKISEARETIARLLDLIPAYGAAASEEGEDPNRTSIALNKGKDAKKLVAALFDKGSFVEMNAVSYPEIVTGIGRIGGIAAAAVLFDGGEKGVELTSGNLRKIRDFVDFASGADLPVVNLVDAKGVAQSLENENSTVLKDIAEVIDAYSRVDRKLAVVYGKAVGLAYSLFAAKSMGYDYTVAFANAEIALFDKETGAEVAFGAASNEDKEKLAKRYGEECSDPFGAARGGYVDDVIEPALVRPYVAASLLMLIG